MSAKKQLSVSDVEKRPISLCGVRQNCYLLDTRPSIMMNPRPNRTLVQYNSLERVQESNGFHEEIIKKDYPINSESVTSYVESSDYRNDPSQAIANAPKRVNLGDISQVQDFVKSNPVDATRQYADILEKVAKYFKDQSANGAKTPTPSTTNSEVNNNG